MLIKKIPKINQVATIVEQIENTIINHDLSPGRKLPTSRELQHMLGVSQGTLRCTNQLGCDLAFGPLRIEPERDRQLNVYGNAITGKGPSHIQAGETNAALDRLPDTLQNRNDPEETRSAHLVVHPQTKHRRHVVLLDKVDPY